MGVLAQGSVNPIDTGGIFSVYVSGGVGGQFFEKLSDQFSRHSRPFYALWVFSSKKLKITNICFTPNLIFCDLKLHAKFQNPRTTLSGRKVCGGEIAAGM